MGIKYISVSGAGHFLEWIANKLKTEEEKKLLDAQARKVSAEADKIKSPELLQELEKIATAKKIEIENLKEATALYKELGFSEEVFREYIAEKLQNVLEVYDAYQVLKRLTANGVITYAMIKEIKTNIPKSKIKVK